MPEPQSVPYEIISDASTAIRVRPMTARDVQARKQPVNLTGDGPLPLFPQVNRLLGRDPQTYQYANEGYSRNSLIFNLITRRGQAVHQAKLFAYGKDKKGKRADALLLSDYQKLLNKPNPYMPQRVFWQVVEIYVCVGGVAFIQKVRDEYGVVKYLYPYHSSQITYIQGEDTWVTGYMYDNGAGFRMEIPKEDMFEIKFTSINFFRPYMAISPLLALLKEVNIDNQRGELEVALLQNGGVPSFAIYPGSSALPQSMTQDQIDTTTERIMSKINGRNRGRPLLFNPGFKMEKIGYSPKDMLLTDFAMIPETRACGVYGVAAGYAQLLSGLQYAGTYANRETDKRAMFEDTIVPNWIAYAEDIHSGMEGEMFHDGTKVDEEIETAFDYSKLPALMEASEKLQGRIVDQWKNNLVTHDRALVLMGEEESTDGTGELYFTQMPGGAPKPDEPPPVKEEPATVPIVKKDEKANTNEEDD